MVALLSDREERGRDGGLAARHRDRARAAFEGRETILGDRIGGITLTRVDRVDGATRESVDLVVELVEDVPRRQCDRGNAQAGVPVGDFAGVHLPGVESESVPVEVRRDDGAGAE